MKNIWITTLAVTTAVLGAVCAMQWRRLQAVQLRSHAIEEMWKADTQAREEQSAKLREAEAARTRAEREVQEFNEVTARLRSSEARQSSNVTALARRLQQDGPGADGKGSGDGFGKGMGEMMEKMMKNPEMREMIRTQQKSALNLMYGGLFKELNLSPEQKDKFNELLLDQQMKAIEMSQGMFGQESAKAGDAGAAERGQALVDAKKASEAEIKALLGDAKFAQYEEYQKNVAEHMQLDQLRTQLAQQNLPLEDTQSAQLLAMMKEEKTRVPPVISDDVRETGGNLKDVFAGDKVDRQLQWMEDYNARVAERAAQVLSPEQFKQFKEKQDEQLAMQKLGMKMAREMFGKDGTAPVGSPANTIKVGVPLEVGK